MQLEHSNELNILYAALNSSLNGVIILGSSGEIRYANPAFLKMLKIQCQDDVFNIQLENLFSEASLFSFKDVCDAIKSSSSDFKIFKLRCKDNSNCWAEVSCKKIMNEQGLNLGYVLSFNDITEKIQIKKDLETKNKDLDNLLKQKDDFIWELGHDLKTPISPLVSMLPIALKKETNPDVKRILEVSIKNANFLKERVNKILERAKSSPFATSFTELNLFEIVSESINSNSIKLQENGMQVDNELDENLLAKGDKSELFEVFDGLIQNCINHSQNAKKITIFAEPQGDKITISFEDDGIGMDKEHLGHIFDDFYKEDESRHDIQTSGLGLSIIKKIILRHGGEIYAHSNGIGHGLTIYFTLKKA